MTRHAWLDELCDVLDIEAEIDEGLVRVLAGTVAHTGERAAAPVTASLLGLAAGSGGADPEQVEARAARAPVLAEGWDRPADAPDPDDDDDEDADDSLVDHTPDPFEDCDTP